MSDPFVGAWRLNPAKSAFDANHQPSEATMVFERDAEGHYLMKAEGLNEKGEKVTERPQRFVMDGQEHPVPDFPQLIMVSTRPASNSLHARVVRPDGSTVGEGLFVVSPDGRSLTATNSGFDAQLRMFEQQTMWERVD